MKKFLLYSIYFIVISIQAVWGQAPLLHTENFDYPAGSLTGNGFWGTISGTIGQVQVVDGNLFYIGYMAPSGRSVALVNGNSEDVRDTLVTISSGKVYISFLLNVTNSTGLGTGAYFAHVSNGWTNFNSRIWIRTSGSGFNLGISKTSTTATIVWGASVYDYGTTYLVVHSYEFATGTDNDSVKLWINPSISGAEPLPDATLFSGTDLTQLTAFNLRQANGTPNAIIDGLRIGTSWSEVFPSGSSNLSVLPSSLSNFSYLLGSGPSASQSYSLSGSGLIPLSDSITVTSSANYEVSLDNINFSSTLKVPYSGGSLGATDIYVRLAAGLGLGSYLETVSNSGGGVSSPVYVSLSGSVLKEEPTDHVTGFTAALGIPPHSSITVSWTDASSGTVPDGYLIKASDVSYGSIANPVDGVPEPNSTLIRNVAQGVQTYTFNGLNGGTTYYFKIFPYTNSGSNINYKTDGSVPQDDETTSASPTLTQIVLPKFIQGTGTTGTNNNRTPFAYRLKFDNLLPNATYRFINQVINYSDGTTTSGAGNCIFVPSNIDSPFVRTSSPNMSTGPYGTFTTDGSGSYTGWFITEPTGNQRFVPGGYIFMRIRLNDGAGGTSAVTYLTTQDSVRVINFSTENSDTAGSGIYGNSFASPKDFVFLYDNTSGSGRPITGTVVEKDGADLTGVAQIVQYYKDNVDQVDGAWGAIIPNQLANGIRRIERRAFADGSVVFANTDDDGVWPSGANTVNPTNGLTPIEILNTEAPLASAKTLNLTALIEGFYNGSSMVPDTITVELRNTSSPYNLVESRKVVLNNAGVAAVNFYNASDATNYYLAIKHRNGLETWSSATPAFSGGTMSYDFTTAASQAYGDNLKSKGGKYCIFSGDIIPQDGLIDLTDVIAIINDANGFVSGTALPTDLNGDDNTDLSDIIIAVNNANSFVSAILP